MNFFKSLSIYGKLSLIGIIIIPWLTIFQGFHHIDEGFIITNFYYFFSHPELINYGFIHYLTDFFGAVSLQIFPGAGILSSRISAIFILYLALWYTYKILSDVIDINTILIGLFGGSLFLNNVDTINWIQYSPLTWLFLTIALYLFQIGLRGAHSFYLFFGGLILGISTFLRLPNIVFLGFIVLIPLYFYIKRDFSGNLKTIAKFVGLSVIGYFIGFWSIILLIFQLGHWSYFLEAINMISGMAKEGVETHNHGMGYLLLVYGKSLLFVILIGISLGLFLLFSGKLLKKLGYKKYFNYCVVFIGVFLGVIAISKWHFTFSIFGLSLLVSYVSFIFPFIAIVILYFVYKITPNLWLHYILGLSIMFGVGIGSGGYLEMMMYGSPLFLPILLHIATKEVNINNLSREIVLSFWVIIFVSSCISTLHIIFINNFPFTYSIKLTKSYYLNITHEQEGELQKFQEIFQEYPKKPLLFLSNFGYGSYLYYLFDVKPYLGNSVPAYYPLEVFEEKLKSRLNQNDYPLILVDKYNGIGKEDSFRKQGETLANTAFDILKKNNISIKKIYEGQSFIIYSTIQEVILVQ